MFNEPYSAKILIYHKITDGEEETVYCRSIDKFRDDLDFLESQNLDIITYDQLIDKLENGFYLERPAVVIAFDDGISSDYEYAYPILKEYDFPAIFFLLSSRQGNWSNYVEMISYRNLDGEPLFSVGSHSYTHIMHGFLNEVELLSQFSHSREAMKDTFGVYPDHLALPFGNGLSSRSVTETALSSGFRSIRGVSPGLINNNSDAAHLDAKLIYSYTDIKDVIH